MNPILVMIPYPSDVGFAIGRLVSAFRQMALRLVDSPEQVHFAFNGIDKGCPALPVGANLLDFCHRSSSNHGALVTYIERHRIRTIFALDMRVDAPCLKAARRAGVRHVISYWGAPMSSIVGWKWPLKRLQVSLTRSKPDLFVFESEAMRRLGVWGRGVASSSTAIVRTGVDADRFKPGPSDVHARFGIPSHKKIIVYVGHCVERKGIQVLMDAARALVPRDDIHVLVLGNRDGEAEQFQAPGNVTFGGYQQDIPALLSGCYAGCIPSTGWDSYPMSSLEMQACGLPVIVSDLQGCPETVNRNTGIVVPAGNHRVLADAIRELVDSPAMRERMSLAARERIERSLTVRHQVDALAQALWSVIPADQRRAVAYERAWEEAAERHPGLYDEQLAQAQVKGLEGTEGARHSPHPAVRGVRGAAESSGS